MCRALLFLCLVLAFSSRAFAQLAAQDDFGARTDVTLAGPAHQFQATCSETATQQICTPVNGSIAASVLLATHTYVVTITSPALTMSVGVNENIKLNQFGNGLDWVYAAQNAKGALNGQSVVQSVSAGTPGSITLTPACSPSCPVIGSTLGMFTHGRWYTGTFTRPLGLTPGIQQGFIDPENHWMFAEPVDSGCSVIGIAPSTSGSVCGITRAITTLSASGGLVTANFSSSTLSKAEIPGQPVNVSGTSNDALFGGVFNINTTPAGNQLTYSDASASGTATGGTLLLLGWTSKFGTSTTFGNDQRCQSGHQISAMEKFFHWNANGIGADTFLDPYGTCFGQGIPAFSNTVVNGAAFSSFSMRNFKGCALQPVHELATVLKIGLPPTVYAGHFTTLVDYFDSRWESFNLCLFGPNAPGGQGNQMTGPQNVVFNYDDSDVPTLSIQGAQMPTAP